MAQKRKTSKAKRSRVKSKTPARTPEEIFAFWDQQSMREAKPISFDVEPPRGEPDDRKEE